MKYSIEGGSLPVALVHLEAGETMFSEAGGRTWSKGSVCVETKSGGAGKALGRLLTGESLFLSYYTAQEPAQLAFASSFPGRIVVRELQPGQSIICQKKAFLAATHCVELSAYVNSGIKKGLFGGEGFLMQRVTGPGTVFLELDGHCMEYDLQPGERVVCDTGVLALMDESVQMSVETVKGIKNILLGGEGLFDTVLTGPGKIYLQTMTMPQIARLLLPFLPDTKK